MAFLCFEEKLDPIFFQGFARDYFIPLCKSRGVPQWIWDNPVVPLHYYNIPFPPKRGACRANQSHTSDR